MVDFWKESIRRFLKNEVISETKGFLEESMVIFLEEFPKKIDGNFVEISEKNMQDSQRIAGDITEVTAGSFSYEMYMTISELNQRSLKKCSGLPGEICEGL